MKTMLISDFKAHCTAEITEACRTGESIVVTRWGRPVVKVEPIMDKKPVRVLGAMKGSMKICGDIVHSDFAEDWEFSE
jgi:antitoxin (DNA-binding transcriptional repressor) of toxin-antitoxin stability system